MNTMPSCRVQHALPVHKCQLPKPATGWVTAKGLSECHTTEIIQTVFSDNSETQLEINNKKRTGNIPKVWKFQNILLNNPGSKIKLENKFKY